METVTFFLIALKKCTFFVCTWIQVHSAFVSALATLIIATFTWALWSATRKLWKVSQKQSEHMETSIAVAEKTADAATKSAKVAEDALHISERAYLKFDKFNIVNFSVGHHINVTYEIHNVGHTPAQIIESLTIVEIVEKDSFSKAPDYNIERGLLGPKQSFIQSSEPATMLGISKNIVTPEEFQSVQNNDKLIFAWGKIIIRDVFGKDWINGFGAVFSKVYGLTMMDGYNYTKEYKQGNDQP